LMAESDIAAAYAEAKTRILEATASHRLGIESAEELLDALAAMRRMVDQFSSAAVLLASARPQEAESPT
ncbi:MAG TPA: hypothetical protein VMK82_08415, partial [Steroidobacteraceae bacterium]|nr:hypothetical protein [Steroidobacteraceae bacterium]